MYIFPSVTFFVYNFICFPIVPPFFCPLHHSQPPGIQQQELCTLSCYCDWKLISVSSQAQLWAVCHLWLYLRTGDLGTCREPTPVSTHSYIVNVTGSQQQCHSRYVILKLHFLQKQSKNTDLSTASGTNDVKQMDSQCRLTKTLTFNAIVLKIYKIHLHLDLLAYQPPPPVSDFDWIRRVQVLDNVVSTGQSAPPT